MNSVPSVGVERAFSRELGVSLEDLATEWREDVQTRLLPAVGVMDRPRKFAQPLLTEKQTERRDLPRAGAVDRRQVHRVSLERQRAARPGVHRPLARRRRDGQANGAIDPEHSSTRTSKSFASSTRRAPSRRTDRRSRSRRSGAARTCSTCSTFVRGRVTKQFDLALESVTRPELVPRRQRSSCSAAERAASRISIVVNADGTGFRRLTDDRFGDFQPQWSPDGRDDRLRDGPRQRELRICSASSRGASRCSICESGSITVLPGQSGLNLNPQWAPDGRSIAYVSRSHRHRQRLSLRSRRARALSAHATSRARSRPLTEFSPSISWARRGRSSWRSRTSRTAQYTVWTVNNPRVAAKDAVSANWRRDFSQSAVADAADARGQLDAHGVGRRAARFVRPRAAGHDALPRRCPIASRLQPDFSARPTIAYSPDALGGRTRVRRHDARA